MWTRLKSEAGSQISVYGVLRHEEANFSIPPTVFSAYSIDNVALDTYNSVMPTGSDDTRGVLFFASGDLASGSNAHQLSVNITNATPTFPYWLDYIIVSSPSTNTSSPLLSSTGSVHIQSLSTDLRSTSSVPVSPSTKTPIPSHSAMPTLSSQAGNVVSQTAAGLIAGFVFGGILILCLLLGSLFLWRRARKETGSPDGALLYTTHLPSYSATDHLDFRSRWRRNPWSDTIHVIQKSPQVIYCNNSYGTFFSSFYIWRFTYSQKSELG